MAYKIVIADVTELSEEIIDVSFNSRIPEDSFARSSDIEAELIIHGKVSFDADKLFAGCCKEYGCLGFGKTGKRRCIQESNRRVPARDSTEKI